MKSKSVPRVGVELEHDWQVVAEWVVGEYVTETILKCLRHGRVRTGRRYILIGLEVGLAGEEVEKYRKEYEKKVAQDRRTKEWLRYGIM